MHQAPPEREGVRLTLPDGQTLEVRCLRHPRARRMRLRVNGAGVALTLPPRGSLAQAQAFAQEHAGWVAAQLRRLVVQAPEALAPFRTTALPLRGEELPVQWFTARASRVHVQDGVLHFGLRGESEPAARRALRDFYSAQARADALRVIHSWAPTLPRLPVRIAFKRLASLWGSMSHAGHLSLDLSLVLAPPPAFEYVVVHELCHLIEANHSPAFWHEVESRFPHWREQRRWFRSAGMALKSRLGALT